MNEHRDKSSDRRPLFLRNIDWFRSWARALADAGVSPNAISVAGLLISIAAAGAFFATRYAPGAGRLLWAGGIVLVLARILANTLDGMVAVECGKTSRVGLLYNEAPDRVGDAVILIACGYAAGGSVVLGYLAACIALFVAYVRTLAQFAGAPGDFSGPMAKGQRVIIIILSATYMAIAPRDWHVVWGPEGDWGIMAGALLVIVVGGVITAAKRLRGAGAYLRS